MTLDEAIQRLEDMRASIPDNGVYDELTAIIRLITPDEGWPQECREERCSYFTHYLRYGPPDLPHAAYHAAERECDEAQKQYEEYCSAEDAFPGVTVTATKERLARRVLRLEKEVRA